MQPSAELVAVSKRLFAALSASDLEALHGVIAHDDDVLVIGTDPDEWWAGPQTVHGILDAQLRELAGWSWAPTSLVAYESGETGWAAARVRVTFPDGSRQDLRTTIVFDLDRAQWKVVQWHISIGVANEDTVDIPLTKTIDVLAQRASGERPAVAAAAGPDGIVTLLFSDIEGSTELLTHVGDRRYMQLLRWHDNLIRDVLTTWDGYEVDHAGDGYLLAFASGRRALRCALDIQDRLSPGPPDGLPSIRVRMGAHAGEAMRDADRFYGHSVHFAARVASAARGGQVLASSVLRDINAGGGELSFREAANIELKGFEGRHTLYVVTLL